MAYFKDLKPGDPLPPRPDDYTHKLVRIYPERVQTAFRDDRGDDGRGSYSVTCDRGGRRAEVIGVFQQTGEGAASPDQWSPTQLYGFTETPLTWRRSDVGKSVRSGYDSACVEARGFIVESLDPLRRAVREGRVTARPLGALSPFARPSFEKLVREFDFYAQGTGRSLTARVGNEEVLTASFRDGARFYSGVDLNHDGIFDVLLVHDEAANRHLFIYDLEKGPAFVREKVPKIRVPREELEVVPLARRLGGEACRTFQVDHLPFPDYVESGSSDALLPMRGLLYLSLHPREPLNPLCARDLTLKIRFFSTDHVNYVGPHRFRNVSDLDRFYRAQNRAIRSGVTLPSDLPNENWIPDQERGFQIPPPPPGPEGAPHPRGRLWRISSLSLPLPEVHWTSDKEGFVLVTLTSVSADGQSETHPFQFPFTAGERQGINFAP